MKLLLMVAGNAAVLWVLWRWVRAQRHIRGIGQYLLPALALRLLAGAVSVISPTADAKYFLFWSRLFTTQLWANPLQWLHTLGSDEFRFAGKQLVFHGHSNTLFFIKVLSALNVLTGGSTLATALYLSVFSFAGCWVLVRQLSKLFPSSRRAAMLGLLVWPSALYWTSGLTKESLLIASGAGLLAAVLTLLYERPLSRFGVWVMLALFCACLHFKMRFFFAGALLAVLGALTVVRVGQELGWLSKRRWQALAFGAVLVAGAWIGSEISPVFRFNKFASQLTRTYSDLRAKSLGRPHISLPELAPTAGSILRYTPKAVASTLLRPFAWEGDTAFYGFAALENMGLLLLGVLFIRDVFRRRSGVLPFALVMALLIYCLMLAALLGLSTPNLGTLSRYRAPWLPVLVYVLASQPTATRWLRRLQVLGMR